MKLTIESTNVLTTCNGAPMRVWNGENEHGKFIVLVGGIMVPDDGRDHSAFERELLETVAPLELRPLADILLGRPT